VIQKLGSLLLQLEITRVLTTALIPSKGNVSDDVMTFLLKEVPTTSQYYHTEDQTLTHEPLGNNLNFSQVSIAS
jgi:hypothetical protein